MGTGQDTGDCEAESWGHSPPPARPPAAATPRAGSTMAPCRPGTRPWHKDVLGQRHRVLPHPSHSSHSWVRAHPRPAWHHCSAPAPALCPSCVWGPFQCRGWLGGSKAAAWGRPGQTQARYNEGQELYLCRAPLGLTACTPAPVAPQNHQLLTNSCSPSCHSKSV